MKYDITTLMIFSVALLNVTVNLVCGVLLMWKRKEVPDRSRTIFAISCFLAVVFFCNNMLTLVFHPDVNPIMEVLSPLVLFTAPVPQLLLFAYPVEVMRPRWMTWKKALLLASPIILLCAPALSGGGIFYSTLFHE